MESMEKWFGSFSKDQNSKFKKIHASWYDNTKGDIYDREERRLKRQKLFLNFIKNNQYSVRVKNEIMVAIGV